MGDGKIGFRQGKDKEEETEEKLVLLEDYIPGAVYDAQGNIVTKESFDAAVKKTKAEARHLNWLALAKLILYSSIGASLLIVSYGAYKKYFDTKNVINKAKTEVVYGKER